LSAEAGETLLAVASITSKIVVMAVRLASLPP
jgi:hypothetical protein